MTTRTTAASCSIRGVTKTFGRTTALDDVSISFEPGEIRALVGENGAGKSTLLSIIGGLVRPDSGELAIGGEPVGLARHNPITALDRGIAVVHQELALNDALSVAENIFLSRLPLRAGVFIDRRALYRRSAELLERVGARFSPRRRVETLSIANRQLVEIAKALAYETRFLALDEPSSVLVGDELELLHGLMRQLADDGVAVAFVSHRLDEVLQVCDTYTVLKDGQVTGSGDIAEADKALLVRLMVGRDVSEVFPPPHSAPGDPVMQMDGITVDGLLADIHLTVREGEIVGLAGLMGSGRTSLAKTLFGIHHPSRGSITIDGHVGTARSPAKAMAGGVAYLPEDRKLDGLALGHSVRWNASLLALKELSNQLSIIDTDDERTRVAKRIEDLAIRTAPEGSDLAGALSGGNQQKVVLGKWLETRPRLLVLDEPTRGIDVGAKEHIYELLRTIADDGVGVLFISSELVEIIGLCDRVVVMREGRVAGELPGDEADEESIVALATRDVAGVTT